MTDDRRDEFDDFVRARHERLCRIAYVLCGDWQHAEDIVQTALAKVYEVYRRHPIDDLDAYAYRAVVTTRASWWRRRWHGEVATGALPEPAAHGDRYGDVDQRRAVLAALAALPPAQREVLALRYLTDLSEADTAAALGCSIGTVKSRAHRAIAALRASGLTDATRSRPMPDRGPRAGRARPRHRPPPRRHDRHGPGRRRRGRRRRHLRRRLRPRHRAHPADADTDADDGVLAAHRDQTASGCSSRSTRSCSSARAS